MSDPVVATLATYPPRYNMALAVIQHVAPQVDCLYVYCNDVVDGRSRRPPWMKRVPSNVCITLGSNAKGNIADLGKFYHRNLLCSAYHVILDDDLQYPQDYVSAILTGVDKYKSESVIGYDGCVLRPSSGTFANGAQEQRSHFARSQESDRPVNLLKTGTLAYHTSALDLSLRDFLYQRMADVFFAIACQQQEVGMISLAKPGGWIRQRATPDTGLRRSLRSDGDAAHTVIMKLIKDWRTYAQAK